MSSDSDRERVVITGMGAITGTGHNPDEIWTSATEGNTSIARLKCMDSQAYRTPNASEVDSDLISAQLSSRGIRQGERIVDLALVASTQALEQAGLLTCDDATQDIAVVFGTGAGSAHALAQAYLTYAEKGSRGIRPTTVPRCMANVISSQISITLKLSGPNFVTISACSSSTVAIGIAFRMIRDGYAATVLCGGSESCLEAVTYAAWDNLGVMSRIEDPRQACRPFDSERKGCILGEGAGALLLESLSSARRRNVPILGEIAGYGESSDASHLTAPNSAGQAHAITTALDCAGLNPSEIDTINAHGTATKANDSCEAEAIKKAFGPDVARPVVVSNKSYFGHLLGASGVVETIVATMSMANGKITPNLNLKEPEEECTLQLAGPVTQEHTAATTVKNSFGFGGHNAVLVLKRWDG